MPPETTTLTSPPLLDTATVLVLADWATLDARHRDWLVELCVGSLGWGSRFGEEFAPVVLGSDVQDDTLPSGVAMYAINGPVRALPETLRVAVLFGAAATGHAALVQQLASRTVPCVCVAGAAVPAGGAWSVSDAAALVDTTFALQAGEVPSRATRIAAPSAAPAPAARIAFEPPPVSIVIPSYNRVTYLRETIASALAQDYPHCRVVVTDDGSTDGSADMVRDMAASHVRLVANPHGGGPANRNRALTTIDTPYVMWVGDDDLLVPTIVRSRIAMLERHPDADVIHGDLLRVDASLNPVGQNIGEDWYDRPDALLATLFQRNPIAEGGALVSMRVYARAGWYDEAFPRGHDYHLWSRLAHRARFKYDPGTGYIWRWHGSNMGLGSGTGGNPYADCHRRIVLEMFARHDHRLLFPQVSWDTIPAHQHDALAALLMADRLGREEAWADAHRFAQLAVTLGLGEKAAGMARTLAVKAGISA